jgi:hypothetical protein
MGKLKNGKDLEAYRASLKAAFDPAKPRICVCGGTGCNAQG